MCHCLLASLSHYSQLKRHSFPPPAPPPLQLQPRLEYMEYIWEYMDWNTLLHPLTPPSSSLHLCHPSPLPTNGLQAPPPPPRAAYL